MCYCRMVVWASLVKAARKAGVWDVAQLGAMMCLLYDDNRWTYSPIGEQGSYVLQATVYFSI